MSNQSFGGLPPNHQQTNYSGGGERMRQEAEQRRLAEQRRIAEQRVNDQRIADQKRIEDERRRMNNG